MEKRQRGRQTKQWKDMSTGERVTGIVTLLGIALIISLAIKFATGGSGSSTGNAATTQATDTSAAQSSQPSVAQQVTAWWGQYGGDVQAFGTDSSKVATDAQSGNYTAVGTDCVQLQSDVKKVQGLPAIPDPQTASDFSSAMSYYSDGAQDCIDGETSYDASLIQKAANEMSQGNTQLGVATNDIQKLSTN